MTAAHHMLRARVLLERDLEYEPKAGGGFVPLRGILRMPTTEELAGGLDLEMRVVSVKAPDLEAIGTPVKHDKIRDPSSGRVYVVQSDWAPVWAGADRVLYHAEVRG